MKIFKFTPLLLIICVLLSPIFQLNASALEDPDVGANAIMLLETKTGDVIFSRNEDAKVYPASLTKIVTVFLALEAVENGQASLYDQVTASQNITYNLESDGSSANIVPGETMSLEDLIHCAMIASANEACNIIAEYIGGTIPNFIQMMNDRAKELGCTNTQFTNAHGLHDDEHYTTARDMCIITQAAIQNSLFMEICNKTTYDVPATNVSESRILSNTNGLINKNSFYTGYQYEYAAGVKTGHTSKAGYCLISTASKDGVEILAVVMGAQATEKANGTFDYGSFSDSIKLYDWAFENFSYQDVLKTTELISEIPISMASDTDTVGVRPARSLISFLPNDVTSDAITREVTIYSERDGIELKAPISAGTVLGEIKVSYNGKIIGTTQLVTTTSIDLSKAYFIKTQIEKVTSSTTFKLVLWIIVLLFVGYVALVIRYRMLRKRHLRSVRAAKQAREMAISEAQSLNLYASQRNQRPLTSFMENEYAEEDEIAEDSDSEELMQSEYQEKVKIKSSINSIDRDYFEEFFKR